MNIKKLQSQHRTLQGLFKALVRASWSIIFTLGCFQEGRTSWPVCSTATLTNSHFNVNLHLQTIYKGQLAKLLDRREEVAVPRVHRQRETPAFQTSVSVVVVVVVGRLLIVSFAS